MSGGVMGGEREERRGEDKIGWDGRYLSKTQGTKL